LVRHDGSTCLDVNSEGGRLLVPARAAGGKITIRMERLQIEPGTYFVDVGVYQKDWKFAYDYHYRSYPLVVRHRRQPANNIVGEPSRIRWMYESPSVRNVAADC